MNIKQVLIVCFITLPLIAYAATPPQNLTIPDELEEMGYTNLTIVDYRKDAGLEFFTFSESKTAESGDTVTFVVENGTVTKDFNGGLRTDVPGVMAPSGERKLRLLSEEVW